MTTPFPEPTPFIVNDINEFINAETRQLAESQSSRHQDIEAQVQAVSLTEGETDFNKEQATLLSELQEAGTDASRHLDQLGEDYRDRTDEADIFLAEHRMLHRPPSGTLIALFLTICATMAAESLATGPTYAPSVGWPIALVIASLVSVGVAGPAMLLGAGCVAARHRLSDVARLLGLCGIVLGALGLAFALACGAHFRELVVANPLLAARPLEAIAAILESFASSWFAPLADPPNWGLAAAGASAGAFTAWKMFRTFGYIGWRDLGLGEKDGRDAILEEADEGHKRGNDAKAAQVGTVIRRARSARRRGRLLKALSGLDVKVRNAGQTGAAIIEKARAAGFGEVRQALLEIAPGLSVASFHDNCPAVRDRLPDRIEFDTRLEAAMDRIGTLLAAETPTLTAMGQMLDAFAEGLRRATERALSGKRGRRAGTEALHGPNDGRP